MNQVNIIGTIGKEIELKYIPSGSAIANFSIAVNQDYKKQDGSKVEKTSWFDVTCFGKTSEIVNQYFGKGSRIGVTGELEQQTWKAQDGSNRSKVVIKMQNFSFIDKKSESQAQPQAQQQQPYNGNVTQQQQNVQMPSQQQVQPNQQVLNPQVINNDEIPFAPIGLQYPMIIHAM